ncbi:MAG: argininosuccinate lyase [Lentisphaeria bacterium]|nr:argininosuccinate lyase [Lentisphaeria bacterium]
MEVSIMALWGGRFSQDAKSCVQEYTESISFDKRLFRHDIAGSKAHAAMLGATGIIPKKSSKAIIAELGKIEKMIEAGKMEFSSALEDIHMHIETELIRVLGNEGARVHTARSRNDQVALDIRLYLRDAVDSIVEGIIRLQKALVDQAYANKKTILPGFTHLQHAQPVLFAHHLLAYVEQFDRDIGRLKDCKARFNVLPLGSGALAGTTLPIDREFVREALNFPEVSRNSMDSVADRDFACELLSALAIFSMHISRLSEDIILWMSQEFSFIELSDAFCTGSSLMPQKKNPDIAEISRGKTGRMYGNLTAMLTICKGLPMTYNRDLQEDKEPLFDSLDTAEGILSVYPEMIATMKTKPEKMLEAAADPGLMATDLAEALVKKGIPFRNAHHMVGALVRYCGDNGKAMDKLSLKEMQSVIPDADADMLKLFSPLSAVTLRESYGGTGFKQVASQITAWKKRLKKAAE